MKTLYISGLLLCCSLGAIAQEQPKMPKLSPVVRMLLRDIERSADKVHLPDGYIYKQVNNTDYLSGVIKVADILAVEQPIKDMGVLVGTRAGNIWTVLVPYDKIVPFTKTQGITYIQLDEPLKPAMDVARKATRVDSVHKAINLPWAFTGQGVVAGIIDFGFDYGHPSFFDTLGTGYRVKKVWELNGTGTPPAGYTYGNELTGDATIQAQGTDNVVQTHGTAVGGVAAGSGFGTTNSKLRGVAYDADLVFVGVRRDAIGNQWMQSSFSDFIDGVKYIFDYASSVSKPSVVNISWGSQSGPHDGSSLFNQACDNLSGAGKIIVMSAGNDGEEDIHLAKTFSGNDTLINTFATFSYDAYKRTWIDIWGEQSKTFCAKVTLYKNGVAGNSTGFVCIDDLLHSKYLIGANGLDTCFIDFITSSSEFNNKPRTTLNIFNKAADSIHISIMGKSGSINVWNEYYYYGYTHGYSSIFESLGQPGATSGNTASTVSDMGSATSVILVGAYASKTKWKDMSGFTVGYNNVNPGELAPFSSRGPMADGRISPDITAPGLSLATATSSFDTRYTPTGLNKQQVVSSYTFGSKTYYHAEFSGTSASAPMTSGIVALMLQANPRLKPADVHSILNQTAIRDNFTGNLPASGDNTWGKGKINAYSAVKAALQANSIYEFNGSKLDCVLFPNPADGRFNLAYTANKNELVTVAVYSITGQLIHVEKWEVSAGEQIKTLDLSAQPKGMYTIRASSAQGSVSIKATVR